MNVEIADINFRLCCEDLPLAPFSRLVTYAPFIFPAGRTGESLVHVDVHIRIGGFSLPAQSSRIFKGKDSWSMFREGEEYCWTRIHPTESGSALLARFHRCPDRVAVCCGEDFIIENNGQKMLMSPFCYPLDQILLMYVLAEREGAFLHASAVDFAGKSFIFPGISGAGKSTISSNFVAKGYRMLSDDRVAVKKVRGEFSAYGTPWAGDANIAENRGLPLKGIFFLQKGLENTMVKLTLAEAFERLLPVTSIPWFDKVTMPSIFSFCEEMASFIPTYDFFLTPNEEAIDYFEEFVHAGRF